jgi:electron transfer flavoprotein alpha subunit
MSGVWVWVEQFEGEAANVSWEAVGLGRGLADALGHEMTVLVFGTDASMLAQVAFRHGADKAIVCEDVTLAKFRLEPYAALVSELAMERQPDILLAGATVCGSELTGAVAVDLETGLIPDAIGVKLVDGKLEATRPVYAGRLMAKVVSTGSPQILTIRGRAFPAPAADPGRKGAIEIVEAVLAEDDIATKVISMEATPGQISLADAAVVVSGGRGIGGPEGFGPLRELASTIGAALGASRAAVDAGWIAYEYQIGQTGKTVSPDLYIACGISGAIQHQAGMRTAKVIVAINTDPKAEIMKRARYAIVDDVFEAIPALTAAFKKWLR